MADRTATTTLCLAGDVMLGRGIDQILPEPVDPVLHESWVRSALRYVELAEAENGPIPRRVDPDYVWGDALDQLARRSPDLRIVNLETSITVHSEPAPKGINYRMSPANAAVLSAARLACCTLANNHVLDWGRPGLAETLAVLAGQGIAAPGAGLDGEAAAAPAVLPVVGGRVLVFAYGLASSGIPSDWAAGPDRAGVAFLPDLSAETLADVARTIRAARSAGDLAVVSVHWGPNWGYEVPDDQRAFARGLIEAAGVDAVLGHSSHHPKAIEIHRGRPILYGAGDLLNDYEGIGGHRSYRPELSLLYLPEFDRGPGALRRFTLLPYRIRRFRLEAAGAEARRWLADRLTRESRRFGVTVAVTERDHLEVEW